MVFSRQNIALLPHDICCIYKITSPSGKIYIGQSIDIRKRVNGYLNFHCKGQQHLYRSLSKYGADSHSIEIIHHLPKDIGQDVLNQYEMLYIDCHIRCGFVLLNKTGGGSGVRRPMPEEVKQKLRGRVMTAETKEKIRNAILAKGDYRKPLTEEHKQKIRLRHKGKSRPEVVRENIKAAMKINGRNRRGIKLSEEHKLKIGLAHIGKKQSDEHKIRSVANRKNYAHSEESKKKISASLQKFYHPND